MIEKEGYEPIAEYAKRVNYSISMIRKLIKNKALKSRKIKGRVYVWKG
jgi:hypothetical protein